ncbi:retrovirus-related pol polyprotein from transposon TNT 1-94 [Tanacetum coccineum]
MQKVKQHYKELYDSIKIMHAKTIGKTTSLLTENEKLKAQLKGKMQCITMLAVKPKVLAPSMYAINVEPILPRNRNNREVHLDYLKHLKECVETLRKIVEEARIEKPLMRLEKPSFTLNDRRNCYADRPLVFGLRLLKTYDGESLTGREFHEKVHQGSYIREFCDSNLEVAFRKHSCYVRNEDGVDLLKGSRGSNLYTIYVEDMMKSSPIYLLSKASKNKSWLWHRRLNHLNFGIINDLARKDLVRGLPRLKFEKDHLRSAFQVLVVSAGTPSSTTIDQDASSISHSPSSSVYNFLSHIKVLKLDPYSAESTQVIQPYNHLGKWSKDHPMDNVIGNPSRLVSTRKQLATDVLWCLYNYVLLKVQPKNVKTAMDDACWFEALQEEIHEFD